MNNAQKPIATTAALLPVACYLVLVGAACYSWAVFGNWPSYGSPDPKNLPVRAVYAIATIATLVGIFSVLLLPVAEIAFVGVRRSLRKEWPPHGPITFVLYGIGAVLWIVSFLRWRTDSGGLVNWIFD